MGRPVAAILLCAGLAACAQAVADSRGVDRDETLVQIAATGRAETRPDEAGFTVGVETLAPTAAAASARNSETINEVVAALRRLGIAEADVQTRSIMLGRIDHGPERGRFRANNTVAVTVRDVERAGPAIAAATDAGANLLSGPSLRIADPEAASREAYAAAYRAARARAEAYAEAAGLRVVRILAIRDLGGSPPMPYHDRDMAMEARAAPAAPPPPVQPGTTRSEVRVQVDFALAGD